MSLQSGVPARRKAAEQKIYSVKTLCLPIQSHQAVFAPYLNILGFVMSTWILTTGTKNNKGIAYLGYSTKGRVIQLIKFN